MRGGMEWGQGRGCGVGLGDPAQATYPALSFLCDPHIQQVSDKGLLSNVCLVGVRARPPPTAHRPPGVGLAAGLQQGQQHRVVLVAAVVQRLLVEVGQQLHTLQTTKGVGRGGSSVHPALGVRRSPAGSSPPRTRSVAPFPGTRQADTLGRDAQLTVGNAALGPPPQVPGSTAPTPQSSARYLDPEAGSDQVTGLRVPRPGSDHEQNLHVSSCSLEQLTSDAGFKNHMHPNDPEMGSLEDLCPALGLCTVHTDPLKYPHPTGPSLPGSGQHTNHPDPPTSGGCT